MDRVYLPPAINEYSILIVDDDNEWAQRTKRYLEIQSKHRIVAEIVGNTAEATEKIKQKEYAAVIVDSCLSPGIETAQSGDDWILSKLQLLRKSHVLMITGYTISFEVLKELRKNRIIVVTKAKEEEFEALDGVVTKAIATTASSPREDTVGLNPAIDKEISNLTRDLFIEWLGSRIDQDNKNTWIGESNYSKKELIIEVENKSAVGQLLVKLFIKQLHLMLNIEQKKDMGRKDQIQD